MIRQLNSVEEDVVYRASVGALMVDSQKRFLLSEIATARKDELDFVKGGRMIGETEEEALKRELSEELGTSIKYEIIEKSNWNVIYEWPEDLKQQKGYFGQARVSYWVLYESGEIILDPKELRSCKWVEEKDLEYAMRASNFPEFYIKSLRLEWEIIKNKHPQLFNS